MVYKGPDGLEVIHQSERVWLREKDSEIRKVKRKKYYC